MSPRARDLACERTSTPLSYRRIAAIRRELDVVKPLVDALPRSSSPLSHFAIRVALALAQWIMLAMKATRSLTAANSVLATRLRLKRMGVVVISPLPKSHRALSLSRT